MIQTLFEITEGWTADLTAQLLDDGESFNAAGMAVEAVLKDNTRTAVTIACDWLDSAHSTVLLKPGQDTFQAVKGPYTIRFQVTSGASPDEVLYYPPAEAAQISVSQL